MKLTIVGAGAFGTALALSYAETHDVTLVARDADTLRKLREAARLPGYLLPDQVEITESVAALSGAVVLLAIPTQALRGYLDDLPTEVTPNALIACCKGIDIMTGMGPVETIEAARPGVPAGILSGPSFAVDIAARLPTALVLAMQATAVAKRLQAALSISHLRLYRSADVSGVQLGGALKNVIAIGCGAAVGARLGLSARAALLSRGLAEITRAAVQLGAETQTLAGLAGLGDLVLTATSEQSRNYRYGLTLGSGDRFDPSVTVEGVATARAIVDLAARHGFDVPICDTVSRLIAREITIERAMQSLLTRPMGTE